MLQVKKLEKIATILLDKSIAIKKGSKLHLRFNPGVKKLAQVVKELAVKKGSSVTTGEDDLKKLARELLKLTKKPRITKKDLLTIAGPTIALHEEATYLVTLRCNEDNEALEKVPADLLSAFWAVRQAPIREVMDRIPSVIVHIPSKAEAKIDGVNYNESLDMFFRAASVDSGVILKAQKALVSYLDSKKEIEIFAGRTSSGQWNTHIKFSIRGQYFLRSGIDANFPGFEVFTSPVRGTISGTYHLPYPTMLLSRRIPNLTLTFEKGKVVAFNVKSKDKKYNQWVEHVLNIDPGAREVGEVAFGTNPEVNYYTVDKLLNEKTPGSFHLAIGRDYPTPKGVKNISNGVRSQVHEDLTLVMWPKYGGGEVYVDGVLVQKDGVFCGPLGIKSIKPLNPKYI